MTRNAIRREMPHVLSFLFWRWPLATLAIATLIVGIVKIWASAIIWFAPPSWFFPGHRIEAFPIVLSDRSDVDVQTWGNPLLAGKANWTLEIVSANDPSLEKCVAAGSAIYQRKPLDVPRAKFTYEQYSANACAPLPGCWRYEVSYVMQVGDWPKDVGPIRSNPFPIKMTANDADPCAFKSSITAK